MGAHHTRRQWWIIFSVIVAFTLLYTAPRFYQAWREGSSDPDFGLVGSYFADGLSRDSYLDRNENPLATLQRQKEITTEPSGALSNGEHERRLLLLYQLTINLVQAEAAGGDPKVIEHLRRAIDGYAAQARAELTTLQCSSFDCKRYESNIRFLAVFAWILERRSTRTGCVTELRFCAQNEGDYSPAARYLLKKTPTTDRFLDGSVALSRKDYSAAAKAYSDYLHIFPGDTEALYARGFSYLQMQLNDEALRDFQECLRLDPRNELALEGKGHALYRSSRMKDAVEAWASAEEVSELRTPTLREWIRVAKSQVP